MCAPRGPAGGVWHEPVAALVHGARTGGARDVVVEAEPLVCDGEFTRADRATVREVVAEARARASELLERAEVPAYSVGAADRAGLDAIV